MNDIFKSSLVLFLICAISAVSLSIVYGYTYEIIQMREIESFNNNLRNIFPEADEFKLIDNIDENYNGSIDSYYAYIGDEIIGVLKTINTQGYAGNIKMLVGINMDDTIKGIRIISHSETPGLGANIINEYFYGQFDGLNFDDALLKRDGGKIDAITGATVTTQSVVKGVQSVNKNTSVIDVFLNDVYEAIDTNTSASPPRPNN
jgi:Na+-translocating ferredoxin:NAD+ oxidoreductase subunit G